ncbi:MAG: dihydroxy-acid dehydratase, partial [Pirellula sp.]
MTFWKDPTKLRSQRWFGPDDLRSFGHRSRFKGMGLDDQDFRDKPIIGILNTWSEMNTCHSHFQERVKEVKRGVFQKSHAARAYRLVLKILSPASPKPGTMN